MPEEVLDITFLIPVVLVIPVTVTVPISLAFLKFEPQNAQP